MKLTEQQFQDYLVQIRELAEGPFDAMQEEIEVTNVFPQEFYDLLRFGFDIQAVQDDPDIIDLCLLTEPVSRDRLDSCGVEFSFFVDFHYGVIQQFLIPGEFTGLLQDPSAFLHCRADMGIDDLLRKL